MKSPFKKYETYMSYWPSASSRWLLAKFILRFWRHIRDEVEVDKIIFLYLTLLSLNSLKKACKNSSKFGYFFIPALSVEGTVCLGRNMIALATLDCKSLSSIFVVEWLYNSLETLLLVGVNLMILLFIFCRRHLTIKRCRLVGPWLATLVTFKFKDSHARA